MVELIDDLQSLLGAEGAQKLLVLDSEALENLIANKFEAGAHLAEYQRAMGRLGSVSLGYDPIGICHGSIVGQRGLMLRDRRRC